MSALLLITGSVCCSTNIGGAPPCFPPEYSVTPSTVSVGGKATVQAEEATCNPRYGQNAKIQITVTDADGIELIGTTAPMNDAGGFVYSFDIPDDAAPGSAVIEALPYNLDWCDDTGTNNRASGKGFAVDRASCAARVEPLNITN